MSSTTFALAVDIDPQPEAISALVSGASTRENRAFPGRYPSVVDSRQYLSRGREAVREEAARLPDPFAIPGTERLT